MRTENAGKQRPDQHPDENEDEGWKMEEETEGLGLPPYSIFHVPSSYSGSSLRPPRIIARGGHAAGPLGGFDRFQFVGGVEARDQ